MTPAPVGAEMSFGKGSETIPGRGTLLRPGIDPKPRNTTEPMKIETLPTSPAQAVTLVIAAYSEKRKALASAVKESQADVDALRSNARNRAEMERRVEMYAQSLNDVEEHIHALDSFETVADRYLELDDQIAALCAERRKLCPSQLIASEFNAARRNGQISIF